MRGKASDRSALRAEYNRLHPLPPGRYTMTTYAARIEINTEAADALRRVGRGGIPNLSNLWRFSHGKRGGMRRRYEPYRDNVPAIAPKGRTKRLAP